MTLVLYGLIVLLLASLAWQRQKYKAELLDSQRETLHHMQSAVSLGQELVKVKKDKLKAKEDTLKAKEDTLFYMRRIDRLESEVRQLLESRLTLQDQLIAVELDLRASQSIRVLLRKELVAAVAEKVALKRREERLFHRVLELLGEQVHQ
eukprot:1941319-Rhodomonas_salina.1